MVQRLIHIEHPEQNFNKVQNGISQIPINNEYQFEIIDTI